jgi:Cu2+-exporting ATPase
MRIAGKATRIIRQNLIWAFAYNLVAIPVAATGIVTPLGAALGMSLSSLIVVGNALRLLPRKHS